MLYKLPVEGRFHMAIYTVIAKFVSKVHAGRVVLGRHGRRNLLRVHRARDSERRFSSNDIDRGWLQEEMRHA